MLCAGAGSSPTQPVAVTAEAAATHQRASKPVKRRVASAKLQQPSDSRAQSKRSADATTDVQTVTSAVKLPGQAESQHPAAAVLAASPAGSEAGTATSTRAVNSKPRKVASSPEAMLKLLLASHDSLVQQVDEVFAADHQSTASASAPSKEQQADDTHAPAPKPAAPDQIQKQTVDAATGVTQDLASFAASGKHMVHNNPLADLQQQQQLPVSDLVAYHTEAISQAAPDPSASDAHAAQLQPALQPDLAAHQDLSSDSSDFTTSGSVHTASASDNLTARSTTQQVLTQPAGQLSAESSTVEPHKQVHATAQEKLTQPAAAAHHTFSLPAAKTQPELSHSAGANSIAAVQAKGSPLSVEHADTHSTTAAIEQGHEGAAVRPQAAAAVDPASASIAGSCSQLPALGKGKSVEIWKLLEEADAAQVGPAVSCLRMLTGAQNFC